MQKPEIMKEYNACECLSRASLLVEHLMRICDFFFFLLGMPMGPS